MNLALGTKITNVREAVVARIGYFFFDDFTTAYDYGSVHLTECEPGPGIRHMIDTGDKATVDADRYSVTSFTAAANPSLRILPPVGRIPGLGLITVIQIISTASGQVTIGYAASETGSAQNRFNFTPTAIRCASNGLSTTIIGSSTTGVDYTLAIFMRSSGHFYFQLVSAVWLMVWHDSVGTHESNYIFTGTNVSTSAYSVDYFLIPETQWLPEPLASDGFSGSWGTTDGLGHVEGVSSTYGSGGDGLVWTTAVGTWVNDGGIAKASALVSTVAIAIVETNKLDVFASTKYVHVGGNGNILVRYVDANNWVAARYTGTKAQMVKNVAGVQTTLVDVTATYSASAELRICANGTKFRLYYNNVFIGTEQTISDAGLQTGTKQGLRTTDTGNTFDDFNVYATGSGGEYAEIEDL
jgi:hypothetical protein